MSTTDVGTRQTDWTNEILVLQGYWRKNIPSVEPPTTQQFLHWFRTNSLEVIFYGVQETARKNQRKQWRGLPFSQDHAIRFASHCMREYQDVVLRGLPKPISSFNPAISAPFMEVAA